MTDKQHGLDKRDGEDTANTRRWITFPVLDWFIYIPSLRKEIHQLKAEGDFRPEGLHRMHIQQLWVFIIGSASSLILYLYEPSHIVTYLVYILFVCIYFSIRYFTPHNEIFPCSIGASAMAVVSFSEFHTMSLRTRGWYVWYEFAIDGGRIIKGNTKRIEKEDMGLVNPEEGEKILVFYDVVNPRHNSMFAPGRFDQDCISNSRYAKRQELCRWGVKHNG